ncbi:hypothetical protein FVB32_05315 [Flagellimonas hymeniacidonis]|uniref:TrbL/VirB6 plasmid conjugal transfer protein n=1 Tax=Flagellimonas hymeniacidonis TaxID=2603628 RepID=A0A5C8VA93_9FLAO|nr:type IV secretion system protein [Flagellimonas hymeniacidonis]TXN37708.1 hypothetical protein FVB32_05315 [Flagellimonas hymeniacidonis]
MDITYESIYDLYENFFTSELNISQILNPLKVLAVVFFVLNVYTNMFSKVGTSWGQAKLPFDQNKLLSSLVVVMAVIFYDKLLDFLDTLLMGFDTSYSHFSPFHFDFPIVDPEDGGFSFGPSIVTEAAAEFVSILKDPGHVIVLILEGIAWMIDAAIYAVFLLERFFFIGLLKVLGVIAIVMAVFEKFRDLFYKWVKLYVSVYLLIIPFFLIMGFSSFVFEFFDSSLKTNGSVDVLIGSKIRVLILAIMIWLKLRLFKKSYDLVYKLLT